MVFLLESIRCDEFDLTPLRSYAPYEQYMTAVERIQSENNTFERIEKITSTIIRRDEGPGPESIRRKEEKLALDLTKVNVLNHLRNGANAMLGAYILSRTGDTRCR